MAGTGILLPVVLSPLTMGWLPLHCDTKAGELSRTALTVSSAFLLEAFTRSPWALSKVTPRASGAHWLSRFKRPAKIHGWSDSDESAAAVWALVNGAATVPHKKAKPANSDLGKPKRVMWRIKNFFKNKAIKTFYLASILMLFTKPTPSALLRERGFIHEELWRLGWDGLQGGFCGKYREYLQENQRSRPPKPGDHETR